MDVKLIKNGTFERKKIFGIDRDI